MQEGLSREVADPAAMPGGPWRPETHLALRAPAEPVVWYSLPSSTPRALQ
jgi:hypothetical protein